MSSFREFNFRTDINLQAQRSNADLKPARRLTAAERKAWMTEKTRKLRATMRDLWTIYPDMSYRDAYNHVQDKGHSVSWASFETYHAPAVRNEIGLVNTGQKGGTPDRGSNGHPLPPKAETAALDAAETRIAVEQVTKMRQEVELQIVGPEPLGYYERTIQDLRAKEQEIGKVIEESATLLEHVVAAIDALEVIREREVLGR